MSCYSLILQQLCPPPAPAPLHLLPRAVILKFNKSKLGLKKFIQDTVVHSSLKTKYKH